MFKKVLFGLLVFHVALDCQPGDLLGFEPEKATPEKQ
jgi:hypothetical protein